jgi:hypothetical protein
MSISHPDLLLHILDEIDFLLDESSRLSKEVFLRDEKAKRAFFPLLLRSLSPTHRVKGPRA